MKVHSWPGFAIRVLILHLGCSSLFFAQQSPSETELSLPDTPLVLSLHLGDLRVTHRDTAIDGGGVRIFAEGNRGFILSAMLETVSTPLTSRECRDQRWKKMQRIPMKYEHLKFSGRPGMALLEYEVPEFQGKAVHQHNKFAFLAGKGLCAIVHVSKVNFQLGDDEYMAELTDTARLEPATRHEVAAASSVPAADGKYPAQISVDFGEAKTNRSPETSYRVNGASDRAESVPKTNLPAVTGKTIYFVPIGDFPADQLQGLIGYYQQRFNLDIQLLPPIPVDRSAIDRKRQQLVSERLIASVRAALPKLSKDPKVILIGFTSDDMYPLSMNWNFAFGWRVETSRTAVVSTARMDLHYPGEPSAIPLPETRLRKMVTKDIGILYYGLPESNNPRSVLYGRILGIEELDTMSEEF